MANENKIADMNMLKEYFVNLLKQKNIKNIDFILIFLLDNKAKKRGYATTQELHSMIDRYVYLERLPYNRQVELLDSFNTYKGHDLDKPFIFEGKKVDLKKHFNQVVDEIQECNPNLLTLGYEAIKTDSDGIVELDKIYSEDVEKRVKELEKKHFDPYRMIFEVLMPYNTKNINYHADKIEKAIIDSHNTRKQLLKNLGDEIIDEKTFITTLNYYRDLDKTERIINELKINPKAKIEYLLAKTGAGESLIKKTCAEYRKKLKKVQ